MSNSYKELQERLDRTHTWPSIYMFKFVIPKSKREELLLSAPGGEISERKSSSGKYISVTIKTKVASSDEIIDAYKGLGHIEGLISL